MPLKEFFAALTAHDWYHEYSDDYREWRSGNTERKRLEKIAQQSNTHKKLYDEFYAHYFLKGPKPVEVENVQ